MNSSIFTLKDALQNIPDPRSKQGVSHPFHGILALVILGLTARQIYMTHIVEWARNHWNVLKEPLGFKSEQPPDATTLSRTLARITLVDFQKALVAFFGNLLAQQSNLPVAVDGKTSKQFHQADGEPIHLLNLFIHDLGIVLAQYSVKEGKNNEESCLRKHVKEFFEKYPFVQLLTGDAIFTARPLLKVLQELEEKKDYLFCVKDNQENILESMVQTFANVDWDKPDFQEQDEDKYRKHEKKEAA
jgi:hypothetical protein